MPVEPILTPHAVQRQLLEIQRAVDDLVRQLAPSRRRRLEAQAAERQLAEIYVQLGCVHAKLAR